MPSAVLGQAARPLLHRPAQRRTWSSTIHASSIRRTVGGAVLPLERDLTAPLAFVVKETPRKYLEGFLNPGDTDVQPKLVLMEPYQRGKIPVVFIHGLGSDPITWVDAINQFQTQRDLYQEYQFWYFVYPTGGELLKSAAALREELCLVRETFDPRHEDAALEQMVLVGHSMGGLVAQLQVTYSSDILWRYAARQPLEAVRTDPATRERLRETFFFDPSPLIKPVVFIGTPHRGSGMALRVIGRVASGLVRLPAEERHEYQQLMANNRDIFYEYLWKAQPTTINLLEPANPLLEAMAQMPFNPCVRLHSVIGNWRKNWNGEWSNGVVSESSARQAGVSSELFVPVRHAQLHKCDASVAELMRLLRKHLVQCMAERGGCPHTVDLFHAGTTMEGIRFQTASATIHGYPQTREDLPCANFTCLWSTPISPAVSWWSPSSR